MAFDEYSNREELMCAILDKSATDQDFREELLEDPQTAIYDEFGIQIPASYRIQFVERDPSLDALVVLPDFQGEQAEDGELSEDDLECVAGGTDNGGGGGW